MVIFMNFRPALFLVSFLALAQESAMSIDSSPQLDRLKVTSIETLPEYISGFPVYVALTITADRGTSFSGLKFANLLDLAGCIGIELIDPEGKLIIHRLPVPRPHDNPERTAGVLKAGESRRMLTDVSKFIPSGIPDGEYRARIVYAVDTDEYHWSNPFTLKFRSPTKVELAWLSSLAPDRSQYLGWTDWTFTQPRIPVFSGEISSDNPLKLNLILRRLFFAPESLEQVDPDSLNVLTAGQVSKLYGPETMALKAELYQARGERGRSQQLLAQILRDTPGLLWWVRMVESGGSFLRTFRRGPAHAG
jgi:hypothetical protein